MTQFASTLYPQNNPTNPILLSFRNDLGMYETTQAAAWDWLGYWELLLHRNVVFIRSSSLQVTHAFRVLTRLASPSG